MLLISLLQQVNIDEKIKNAPDNGYLIGVWIGNILPFVVLVGLAWWMYIRAKKRQNDE
jgi:formate/nitrite transporter FocA (FNT family)